jgi:hypothetical protein
LPSHCGILGNERADSLAVDAVVSGDVSSYKNYCHDLLLLPKRYLQLSWEFFWFWSSLETGAYYHRIQSDIPLKPWFYSKKTFNRREISCITRMRLGHTCAPSHLAKFNIISDPKCDCGAEEADVNHIILSCPLYDRTVFLDALQSKDVPFPTEISSLLGNLHIYNILAKFICENNIKL